MLRRNIDVTVGLVNGAIGTGLSLDPAIFDLSTDVFGDGMAYVALSRVRTLNGFHLLSFDPLSLLKLVVRALTELTASEVNFGMTYLKSRKVKERRERFK
uniref:Uncharacterized protein n=1 Tax=Amphimedon queenslandica TaxID=400682 RepID=A0A1X7T2U6_AMPQE